MAKVHFGTNPHIYLTPNPLQIQEIFAVCYRKQHREMSVFHEGFVVDCEVITYLIQIFQYLNVDYKVPLSTQR